VTVVKKAAFEFQAAFPSLIECRPAWGFGLKPSGCCSVQRPESGAGTAIIKGGLQIQETLLTRILKWKKRPFKAVLCNSEGKKAMKK
jgi:hypothetical protein